MPLAQAHAKDFDAILLPGGVISPDKQRLDKSAVLLSQVVLNAGKPVASIYHGPCPLIETGRVRGRRLAS